MDKEDLDNYDEGKKIGLAYEVIEKKLDVIWHAIDSIDSKTNIILGFASVVLALIAGFFSGEKFIFPTISKYLFYGALLAYIVVVILSILSYRIKEWSYRPDPETLISNCRDKECSLEDIKNWIVNECKESYEKNLVMLKNKSKYTNCVLVFFSLETFLLVSSIICGLVK